MTSNAFSLQKATSSNLPHPFYSLFPKSTKNGNELWFRERARTAAEKEHFYADLRSEWDLHSMGELVLGMGDFNGNVGKRVEGYEDVHGENGIRERNVVGKMLEFCDEKELFLANTWFTKGESDLQHWGK